MGMMKYASAKGINCLYAPTENLPVASGTVDRMIMMDAFHHVQNQEITASELYRVLRTGGQLLIIEPDIHNFYVKLIALAEKLMLMRSKFLDGERIASHFSNLGAKVETEYTKDTVCVKVEKV
jgi:ubiquinone/menaquinone biosynthesis C-methylase UbiE